MVTASRLFRCSHKDALLAGAALLHGALLVAGVTRLSVTVASALPAALVIAIGVWWGSNTISHNHLHNPLFRSRTLNQLFSLYLTLLYGIPQSIWRARHFWHHAAERGRMPRAGLQGVAESLLVVALAALLLACSPRLALMVYLPGWLAGLLLCKAQGHFEHAGVGAPGISHYSGLYNFLWFNDGYHVEHHRQPSVHWTLLPARRDARAISTALPPLLRWAAPAITERAPRLRAARSARDEREAGRGTVVGLVLGVLERWGIGWRWLSRFMVARHARAFRRVLPRLSSLPRRVCIVGGGLFPRTALVLAELLPEAQMVIADASGENLRCARAYLATHHPRLLARVVFEQSRFDADTPCGCDLLIVPLAFVGDREALYRRAGQVIIHDWIWRRRGRAGAVVSWLLFKRLNLA